MADAESSPCVGGDSFAEWRSEIYREAPQEIILEDRRAPLPRRSCHLAPDLARYTEGDECLVHPQALRLALAPDRDRDGGPHPGLVYVNVCDESKNVASRVNRSTMKS